MLNEGPVTFIVSRVVKPGREAEYEAWIKGISQAALKFEGHLGVNVIRPDTRASREYVIIYRFDTYHHLKAWEDSPERYEWLAQMEALVEGETRIEKITGLEYWFTQPGVSTVAPPRYKQGFVSWLALFPLSTLANALLGPILAPLPLLVRTMIITALLIPLMTYVVMPRMTRLFARWLYPTKGHHS